MKKTKQNPVLLGICVLLIAFVFAMEIYLAVSCADLFTVFIFAVFDCVSLFVLYYILAGYKKPHGNMLRYLMLAFAFAIILDVSKSEGIPFYAPLRAATVFLIGYIAGRLNKINQNKVLMSIVFALIFAAGCIVAKTIPTRSVIINIAYFLDAILWLVICSAYLVRCWEHKEAGLTDAPKVK